MRRDASVALRCYVRVCALNGGPPHTSPAQLAVEEVLLVEIGGHLGKVWPHALHALLRDGEAHERRVEHAKQLIGASEHDEETSVLWGALYFN